jgi:hypothetical protein
MKELVLLFILPLAMIGLLRSEATPYRIYSTSEIDEMKATANAQGVAQGLAQGIAQARATQQVHDGSWMHDYRSALEKPNTVGLPGVRH